LEGLAEVAHKVSSRLTPLIKIKNYDITYQQTLIVQLLTAGSVESGQPVRRAKVRGHN
jgi:hypothetical protein